MDHIRSLVLANARDLLTILEWNESRGIRLFRLSSDMCPFIAHPEMGYHISDLGEEVSEALAACGRFALDHGHRISSHPGPFNVLASPNPQVVDNTIRELDAHAAVFDAIGLPRDHNAKINIHVGGAYGDPLSIVHPLSIVGAPTTYAPAHDFPRVPDPGSPSRMTTAPASIPHATSTTRSTYAPASPLFSTITTTSSARVAIPRPMLSPWRFPPGRTASSRRFTTPSPLFSTITTTSSARVAIVCRQRQAQPQALDPHQRGSRHLRPHDRCHGRGQGQEPGDPPIPHTGGDGLTDVCLIMFILVVFGLAFGPTEEWP